MKRGRTVKPKPSRFITWMDEMSDVVMEWVDTVVGWIKIIAFVLIGFAVSVVIVALITGNRALIPRVLWYMIQYTFGLRPG